MFRTYGATRITVLVLLLLLAFPLLAIQAQTESVTPAFAGLASVRLENDVFYLSWTVSVDDATDPSRLRYDVFASEIPGVENYDFRNPIASATGVVSVGIAGLDPTKRHYFIVRACDEDENCDQNTIERADRVLHLTGDPNFRDFGGYINSDGQQVAWGLLYRSGKLSKLTDNDVVVVNTLGLNRIFDLRNEHEILEDPDRIYEDYEEKYDALPFLFLLDKGLEAIADPVELVQLDPRTIDFSNMYTHTMEANKENIKKVFERLTDSCQYPILEHCTAGKDRAGITAALVLLLLGVPKQTIVEDFALTCELTNVAAFARALGQLLEAFADIVPAGVTVEDWMPLIGCPTEAMVNLLAHIDTEYGGIEGFLTSIGITLCQQQAIRDILLKD
jgi:protein-tyrosine phosphatase